MNYSSHISTWNSIFNPAKLETLYYLKAKATQKGAGKAKRERSKETTKHGKRTRTHKKRRKK